MGFWSELKKANPHEGVKRGEELAAAKVSDISPIERNLENSGEICSVCRAEFGSFGFKNVQPFTVTVEKPTPLSFSDTSKVIVCAKCISVFAIG
jgi:hypothetical protein